jgi:hypothetical protein
MSANYTDGDFTKKWPIGTARKSFPIERDLTCYLLEQDYMQAKTSYSVAALNTTHYAAMGGATATDGGATGDASAYLVAISQHQDMGQGIVRWTETYSTKPASRDEYESFVYNFIGYYGGAGQTNITGRNRFTRNVMSRLAYAYYIPGLGGGEPANVAAITLIAAQKYVWTGTTNDSDWLAATPFSPVTDPTRTAYEAVVAGGAGLGTGAAAGEIVAEQSIVRPWRGGIYERVTRYIMAQ